MKIGILGALGGIGASMLSAMANAANFVEGSKGPRGGKRSKVLTYQYAPAQPPEAKRHWHDLTKPDQLDRFSAAEAKREARACRLQQATAKAAKNNDAHFTNGAVPGRLNPFHISK